MIKLMIGNKLYYDKNWIKCFFIKKYEKLLCICDFMYVVLW